MAKNKLKKKTTTTVVTTIKEEWVLSKNLKYVRITQNDEHVSNSLVYTGKDINNYSISPIWNPDLEMLKKWNPYWGENKDLSLNKEYSWFSQTELPEPEDINIEDIIYAQSASHSFFDINLEPLPVVLRGDYIEASLNSAKYYLDKLKEHFDSHPNIVYCAKLDVPFYNADSDSGSKYLEVLVYPDKEWLKDVYANKKSRRDIFTSTWDKSHPDYLQTRQFMKPVVEDEE